MSATDAPYREAEWLGVHPSQLMEFGALFGDGSDSHWFGRPLTDVPLYGHWGVKPGKIRVHTRDTRPRLRDVDVPWGFATPVKQRPGPQWREPVADMPPAPGPQQWVKAEDVDPTWDTLRPGR